MKPRILKLGILRNELRWLLVLSITLLVVHIPLPGIVQAAILLGSWAIAFAPLKKMELIMFFIVNIIYVAGDIAAVSNGIFSFSNPDMLGLPFWEFFMWGFFVLFTHRIIGNHNNIPSLRIIPFILGIALFLAFQITDYLLLAVTLFSLLGVMLFYDHSKDVIKAVVIMVGLGTILEYSCVINGIWSYPPHYYGGVAYWYAALFGATGFICQTIIRPILVRKC